ncbi:hypothetical protein M514_09766 [Trichuris suis]|uniref:Ribosomal protein L15 n=1 Tax=Trichuris suis TaxID=68888 RepID=A0A085NMD2_9BILA|nr:hypothetical protein M514_09766 [Trichuris suis]
MGAYRYVQEIWRKKQSDVMRFLLRVRTWHYRQLPTIHRASRPTRPEKARRLGYRAKQGFVIYRIRIRRGGRKRKVTKGQTYGKPKTHGVNQLKPKRNLQAIAEQRVGRHCGALRVLNSYWVGQDSTFKYYEVILIDPMHKAIRRDPKINWICKPVMKHREMRGLTAAGRKSRGLGKARARMNRRYNNQLKLFPPCWNDFDSWRFCVCRHLLGNMVLDAPNEIKHQSGEVQEEEKISPAYIAKEFAHQYYRVLNMAPGHIHRFYSFNSTLVLEDDEEPSVGQAQIQKRFSKSVLTHCSTRIYAIHGLYTLNNGVVAQVIGEMSLPGKPMRYFTQTFVLEQQTAHKYYISNDIFCFLDSAKANSLWPMPVESYGNGCCEAVDDGENICDEDKSHSSDQAGDEKQQQQQQAKEGALEAANDVASDQVDLSKQDEKTMATDAFCKTEEVVVTAPAAAEQNGTEADKSIPSEGVENSVPKEDNCEEQTTWATIVKTPSEKQETDSRLKTTAECRTMQKNLVS